MRMSSYQRNHVFCKLDLLDTPYSMNSLFSELFQKFGGVFLEVYETISGGIWEVFEQNIEDNYPEQIRGKN